MNHPFAELIGLQVLQAGDDKSVCRLEVVPMLHNPQQVAHGAVLYALADTGMGAALYPGLSDGELCATIEIKINYFKPVREGEVVCQTELISRGKTVANLESSLWQGKLLVAKASGNFGIFTPKAKLA